MRLQHVAGSALRLSRAAALKLEAGPLSPWGKSSVESGQVAVSSGRFRLPQRRRYALGPHRVGVVDEERSVSEHWQRLLRTAPRVEQKVALVANLGCRRAARALTHMRFDLLGQVMNIDDRRLHARRSEAVQAVVDQRALQQRIRCGVAVGEKLMEVRHPYDEYDVILVVYRCDLTDTEPVCGSVAELAWVYPEQLTGYAFPGADQQTVDLLIGSLE